MTSTRTELSPAEAAEYKGVHPATIRRWLASGALIGRRCGPKLIRIKVSDLDAMGAPVGGAA
ncbi:helix-turn-helix domain-containing protein [Mycobacterium intracellulare]|uniref:helix-turn-helix domain-containing protein n=1 Tax=Mycobacterium intracellulare TaxID=1767 RepID=UPI001EEDE9EA|nr:helix-turn-helix domain-containing protein [Mycobacterium intracellulare]MEE3753426.1 helix-turn-helix domain-containing protein [Mycobacterium intracellulare]